MAAVIQQTPALSVSSSSPSASTTSLALQDLQGSQGQVQFASKVASLPFVNSALKAYEMSKASSSVVKVCVFCLVSYWFVICDADGWLDGRLIVRRRDDGVVCFLYFE